MQVIAKAATQNSTLFQTADREHNNHVVVFVHICLTMGLCVAASLVTLADMVDTAMYGSLKTEAV